jgi:hypothetical protein
VKAYYNASYDAGPRGDKGVMLFLYIQFTNKYERLKLIPMQKKNEINVRNQENFQ